MNVCDSYKVPSPTFTPLGACVGVYLLKQRGRRLPVAAAGTAGEDSEVRFTSFFFLSAEEEEMSQT